MTVSEQISLGTLVRAMVLQVLDATKIQDIPIGGWNPDTRIFLCTNCTARGKIPDRDKLEFDIEEVIEALLKGEAKISQQLVAKAVAAYWKGKIKGPIMDREAEK